MGVESAGVEQIVDEADQIRAEGLDRLGKVGQFGLERRRGDQGGKRTDAVERSAQLRRSAVAEERGRTSCETDESSRL